MRKPSHAPGCAAAAAPVRRLLAGRMRAVAVGRATAVRRSDGLRRAAFCGAVRSRRLFDLQLAAASGLSPPIPAPPAFQVEAPNAPWAPPAAPSLASRARNC